MVVFGWKKKLEILYNKEDYDYSTGIVDPFKFHKLFYWLARFFRVVDEPVPKWTCPVVIIMTISYAVGAFFAILATSYYIEQFDVVNGVQTLTYSLILVYKCLIMSCTKYNKSCYHTLMKSLKDDFAYVCTKGKRYRKQFFDTELLTWKICLVTMIFMNSLSTSMVSFAIIMWLRYIVMHRPGDDLEKPFLFPYWAWDVDFKKSPIYEITFFFANYVVLIYGISYSFLIQTLIIWIRHITIKLDLIEYALEDLMEGVEYATNEEDQLKYDNILKNKMRDIILQHNSVFVLLKSFSGVYRKLLMFQQKISAILVSLTSFGAAAKLAEGEFHGILAILCIAIITVLFIPSYFCDYLGVKIRSVCDACANVTYWEAKGKVLRPYLVLMMQRSLRPLPLQAPGFEDTSLKTFSANMASAYSMFNMLRQTNIAVK